jgi:hypothetical protein
MPTLPRMTRRRLLLAGLLLAAASLLAVLILTAPGPLDAARAKYDRLQVGMAQGEARDVLSDWQHLFSVGCFPFWTEVWEDRVSGASVVVDFNHSGPDSDAKVTEIRFVEGDQSFRAKVGRLKDRLAGKLHRGP